MITLLGLAVLVPLAGGLAGRLIAFLPGLSRWLGAVVTSLGGVAGAALAIGALTQDGAVALEVPWFDTGYVLHLGCDAISGFFLLPISIVGAVSAWYGAAYLGAHGHGASDQGGPDPHQGGEEPANVTFFLGILQAGMVLVVLARDVLGFLMAWEAMSLAAFFLVTWEDRKPEVRNAGWTYLVATHIGTAFLLFFFLYLAGKAGSPLFSAFGRLALPEETRGLLFLAALVGFGAKAGLVPLHIWLPEAHPAAPSHVSAVMSGVMIKTGIYGIVRTLTFLGPPGPWWGWVLVAVGLGSGVLGVIYALAQKDLKRLLAYCSVENLGIIALGLGLGLYGAQAGLPTVAVLGLTGGLLHVLNHALFKGLLFLGAGVIAQTTGTREIDRLGGLSKRMPTTAGAFLVGSMAIAGLVPLNGFLSEFLIYQAALSGLLGRKGFNLIPLILSVGGLALIGGLAAACFAKVYGIIFLGEPRTPQATEARPPHPVMTAAMVALAFACALVAFGIPTALPLFGRIVAPLLGLEILEVELELVRAGTLLQAVVAGGWLLLLVLAVLAFLRYRLLAGREIGEAGTWDCGYASPQPRMAYTGSSFSQPLAEIFQSILGLEEHPPRLEGPFPVRGRFISHVGDVFADRIFGGVFGGVQSFLHSWRWLQSGRLQVYLLYIALTLLTMLVWNLW